MLDVAILGQVALGYSPFIDRNRSVSATRLTVFPLRPDSVLDVANNRFTGNALVWVYGIVGGAVAVTLAGWLGTRSTVNEPPLTVLRQLG